RPDRRERLLETFDGELVDVLGDEQVLQPALAEVSEPCTLWEVLLNSSSRGRGHQDLPAVRCIAQARDPVQGRAEVVALPLLGEPHVHGYTRSNPEVAPALVPQRPLATDGRFDRYQWIRERHAERVSNRLEHRTAGALEDASQQHVMAG